MPLLLPIMISRRTLGFIMFCVHCILAADVSSVDEKDLTFPKICELMQEERPPSGLIGRFKDQLFVPRLSDAQVNEEFSNATTCERFKSAIFNDWPNPERRVSQEELEYPIAFSMSIHRDAHQVARLLRLLYREHNTYCIHVDRKAPSSYYSAIVSVARCFGENVYVIPPWKRVRVYWGYYSLLHAVLLCAEQLLEANEAWRYLINLCGQEMPLKTNRELVSVLKALNGSNLVEYDVFDKFPERVPSRVRSFKWVKGSVYSVVKREFVQFAIHDSRALAINQVLRVRRKRIHQDESFYPTLNYNPTLGAPGACWFPQITDAKDPATAFLGRYVIWFGPCLTNYSVHTVCILGLPDMPQLVRAPHLIANKFYHHFHPAAYDCMEWWMLSKWRQETLTDTLDATFNREIYAQLQCSQLHN